MTNVSITGKIVALSLAFAALVMLGAGCQKATFSKGADQMIRNVNIQPGDKIGASPLKVTGEAKGPWYFEADFPIDLKDSNGKLLGQGIAQAQGEWMTEEFVKFETNFSYAPATTTDGTLTLHRHNASGLPEHDAWYTIPVKFK